MKQILRGYICRGDAITWDNCKISDTILLVSEDLTEVIGAIAQLLDNFDRRKVTLFYYINDKPLAKEELQEAFLYKTLGGKISVEFNAGEIVYSEVTRAFYTNDKMEMGGHSIKTELYSYLGKFLHLEIETV